MSKILEWYQSHIKQTIISFLVISLLCVGAFLGVYYGLHQTLQSLANASAVAFAISFSAFAFSLLNRFGAFDTLSYGFSTFFRMFTYKQERKYTDLVQYRDLKNKKRLKSYSFLTYLFVAVIFLIVLIIFEIKFNNAI